MRNLLLLTVALSVLLPALQPPAQAATTNEEQSLIAVLQSVALPKDKDAACAKLKRIGTDRSVPALAALLTDEQLSHSARYALESMPSAKAGSALTAALAKTSGLTKAGIIGSLGFRHETQAVPALAKSLTDQDSQVAAAAATALGQIGGSKALSALQAVAPNCPGPVHDAMVDACLRCGYNLLAAGSESKALAAFQQLYDNEKKDFVRTAAYRGMIQSSGKHAAVLMTQAILGTDGPSQVAALQLVHEVSGPDVTKAMRALLHMPSLTPPIQVALVEGLSQRGDPAAAGDISILARSESPEVRLAVIKGLGVLGDASVIPLLAVSATSTSADEQTAARLALGRLCRGNVTETLLRLLPEAKPEVQAELARALGDRGDKTAVPKLVELGRQGSESAAKAALQALALLVEGAQVDLMVQLVAEAKTDTARADAAEALNSACHNIQTHRGDLNLEPLVRAATSGSAEARVALLPVCTGLIDPKLRPVVRAALASSDPQIRAAAIRALCDTSDAELLPDVLKVACSAPEANFRTLAIRACVRLTTQEETIKLPVKARLAPFKSILATDPSADQKRVVLAGLAEIPDLEALKLSAPMLDEAPIQLEAARSVTKVALAISYLQAPEVTNALTKVLAVTTDADSRKAAETALNDIQAGADYIMGWQVAGPYMQEGKDCKELFDIAFPPESSGGGVKWKALPAGSEPKRPWVMDLLKALGGEQRVAYARTWVYSPDRRPAQLELGSDDGIKVWCNHQVVYSNNTTRGLSPGSDRVQVTLNNGWNPLELKVTQLNQGWAFCVRVRKPDGSHMDGLKFSAQPPRARGVQ
jgi:HEAT repeat protein